MHLNRYQSLAARTINPENDRTENMLHALFGLSSEVGELHDVFQKHFQGHDLDTEHMKKEAGDILWMLSEFCTMWGWMLDDIAQINLAKTDARYPKGFTAENSLNRKEGDI